MIMSIKRVRMLTVLGAIVLVAATGCGSDTADAGSTGSGGGGGSGSGGNTVKIKEPTDGASIEIPFTLSVDSSVPLGTTDSGLHHVHLYFDGKDSNYEVVESDSMQITDSSPAVKGLKPGKHELDISLRNADHSPAGFDTHIMVNVTGAGGGGQPSDDDDSGSGGGGGY
jgi:hypothetical protein